MNTVRISLPLIMILKPQNLKMKLYKSVTLMEFAIKVTKTNSTAAHA